ncbi:glycoside hydrolase family 95 protein [Sclerotinia borealis F-4128]|uniref:Glycoside hydrolase family 95 protein n=1 Tax=Sclerotinia borealis (strain F-4128) TaxID=1432307 RepID=W9C4G4_SCLBF|nr:glycoside hydrolase family 95 protein [Sclerotinia borealis F-4128]
MNSNVTTESAKRLLVDAQVDTQNVYELMDHDPMPFAFLAYAYPIGNGQLAALPFGEPGFEKLSLNRDSLWNGGPFESASYSGGNPNSSVVSALPGIRDWIFQNGTGNVSALMGSDDNYGSYQVLGNLSVSLQGISGATGYKRMLDLDTGIHTTNFKIANASFTTTVYCSYPDSVCVYEVTSTATIPRINVHFENVQSDSSLVNSSCSTSSKSALFSGITQTDIGMIYKAEARVLGSTRVVSCSNTTGILGITPSNNQRSLFLVISAGTNYDATKGTAANDYSFRGKDPGSYVSGTVAKAASRTGKALRDEHVSDFSTLMDSFTLNLPDPLKSANKETAAAIAAYNTTDNSHTDPWLESLLFDYSRYLFISSSRGNSLPPNLQGKWAYSLSNAWGADYHSNINLQMNHWVAVQTGLGDLQAALWTYMTETWAPRGAETAKLLYNAPGWVVHDEINIFGHTVMKTGDEYWADYPVAAAWMMQHVADYYDYSRDEVWLRETGYPLLKAISEFWLSQLQIDRYFNDGTLVVNPCSSPEHGPTTFGCTHYQQLIHSLFTSTLQAARTLSTDTPLQKTLAKTLPSLDKGLHISPTYQIQEWKIYMPILENSTHRHLSHLIGWFPGSSLSSHLSGYTNPSISSAVHNSLSSRGPGIADSNAGWEKVWRAACWARLNDTDMAYGELRLVVGENLAGNGLSMYSGKNEPFQIDANFGFGGAVLAMLVVDLPGRLGGGDGDGDGDGDGGGGGGGGGDGGEERTIVLGPAIPKEWGGGTVKGLRVRGGGVVDFKWDSKGVVVSAVWKKKGVEIVKIVNIRGKVLA